MRWWTLILLLVGCRDGPVEVPEPGMPRMVVGVPRAGALGPVVLYPRHRILSGMPTVLVAAVADAGPIDIELVRGSGRRRRWRTRQRVLPWPAGWMPLTIGEEGRVSVTSCGRTDVALWVRAPRLPVDLRWRSARRGARWLLANGLPMEALRLIATDPGQGAELRTEALIRSGFPVSGQWLHP